VPPSSTTVPAPPSSETLGNAARARRGWLIAALAAVAVLVCATALVVASSGGSSQAPPASAAATLVPADALLYVHLSTDPARPAVRRVLALLGRLPDRGSALAALPQRVVDVVGGRTGTDFTRDIRPWLGREAAFALLNTTGGSAGSLTVLDVRSRAAAVSFLARQGAQRAGSIAGAMLYSYPSGAELAFIGRFLVVGADGDVRSAIEAHDGRLASLATNATYRKASADAPAGRVLDAYASAGGVLRILDSRSGFLGALGSLISPPSLLGVQLSVTPQAPGLAVHIHAILDHATAASDVKRLAAFTPTLAGVLPQRSTLMIDARNLSALAPIVFGATTKIGLLGQVPDLLRRLGIALRASGVNVQSFLNLFAGETAVALASGSGSPALVIVTRTSHEPAARQTLADMEPALAQLFSPAGSGGGQEPEMSAFSVGGVTANQVQLGPGLQVDFAVFQGLIVLATTERGIGDVVTRVGSLDHGAGYGAVLGNHPGQVTSLGFADFSQLLNLGEQTQLAHSAGYRRLVAELQQVRAVGLYSTRGEDDTTAELFLQIP
jgi:hypothetical protein